MDEKLEKKLILDILSKYGRTAIEHANNPHNLGSIPQYDGFGRHASDCDDTIEIYLSVRANRIVNITFMTNGCGATIACGSMITELAKGNTVDEAYQIGPEEVLEALGGLPDGNVHCADIAVNALREALHNYREISKFPWKKAYLNASNNF